MATKKTTAERLRALSERSTLPSQPATDVMSDLEDLAEKCRNFVDAYDDAVNAAEDLVNTREEESYPGKGDDVRNQVDTTLDALGTLATALDELEGEID